MKIDKSEILKIIVTALLISSITSVTIGAAATLPKPIEKTIVLRLDDVQGDAWDPVVMNLTDTALKNNINITLGVIPVSGIDKDLIIKNYLTKVSKDPRVEIAQHGYKHANHEYLNIAQNQAFKITKLGRDTLEKLIGVKNIVTFIPPYNEYNKNTEKALSALGFKVISAGQDEYSLDQGLMLIGYNAETSPDQKKLTPVNQVISDCQKSLNKNNICVIMIHPEEYAKNNDMNPSKYKEYLNLLDGLKKLKSKFATFDQLNIKAS